MTGTTKITRMAQPESCRAVTHKFSITDLGGAVQEYFVTVNLFEDGRPCSITVTIGKPNPESGGLMDSFCTAISLLFQYGIPLEEIADDFINTLFAPSGATNNKQICKVRSVVDYIFRWMLIQFPSSQAKSPTGPAS